MMSLEEIDDLLKVGKLEAAVDALESLQLDPSIGKICHPVVFDIIRKGRHDLLRKVESRFGSLDFSDRNWFLARVAATHNQGPLLRELFKRNIDTPTVTAGAIEALHSAVASGHHKILEWLIERSFFRFDFRRPEFVSVVIVDEATQTVRHDTEASGRSCIVSAEMYTNQKQLACAAYLRHVMSWQQTLGIEPWFYCRRDLSAVQEVPKKPTARI